MEDNWVSLRKKSRSPLLWDEGVKSLDIYPICGTLRFSLNVAFCASANSVGMVLTRYWGNRFLPHGVLHEFGSCFRLQIDMHFESSLFWRPFYLKNDKFIWFTIPPFKLATYNNVGECRTALSVFLYITPHRVFGLDYAGHALCLVLTLAMHPLMSRPCYSRSTKQIILQAATRPQVVSTQTLPKDHTDGLVTACYLKVKHLLNESRDQRP